MAMLNLTGSNDAHDGTVYLGRFGLISGPTVHPRVFLIPLLGLFLLVPLLNVLSLPGFEKVFARHCNEAGISLLLHICRKAGEVALFLLQQRVRCIKLHHPVALSRRGQVGREERS